MANNALRSITIWTISTLAAAFFGGAITLLYQMARPAAELVGIRPSLSVNNRFVTNETEITVPDGLRRQFEKSTWVRLSRFRPKVAKYNGFIESLHQNERRLNRFRRLAQRFSEDFPTMSDILKKSHLAIEDRHHFFDLWERNDGFIHSAVSGDFRRGSLSLPDKIYDRKPVFRLFQEEITSGTFKGRKRWLVAKEGGRFPTSFKIRRPGDFVFQKQLAHALAYFNRDALTIILEAARADVAGVEYVEQILREIDEVRTQFSRWAATLLISNSGSRSLAVLPFAELIVETQTQPDAESDIRDEEYAIIPLELRTQAGEPAAIQVQGGNAILVTFASTRFVADQEKSQVIRNAYGAGDTMCYVRLFTAGGGYLTRSTIVTRKQNFASTLFHPSSQSQ